MHGVHSTLAACLVQEVFRKAAVAELTKRLQGSLTRANESATADMDKLLEQQAKLTRRGAEVAKGIETTQVRQRHYQGWPPIP